MVVQKSSPGVSFTTSSKGGVSGLLSTGSFERCAVESESCSAVFIFSAWELSQSYAKMAVFSPDLGPDDLDQCACAENHLMRTLFFPFNCCCMLTILPLGKCLQPFWRRSGRSGISGLRSPKKWVSPRPVQLECITRWCRVDACIGVDHGNGKAVADVILGRVHVCGLGVACGYVCKRFCLCSFSVSGSAFFGIVSMLRFRLTSSGIDLSVPHCSW